MEKNEQDVGATAFDLPNNQNPWPYRPAYHGNTHVPRPTNNAAKMVDASKIMRHVNDAK